MFTLFDRFDDAEGIKVAWIARGDDAIVDNDFRIFPFRAGVRDIRLDRLVGGQLRPLAMPVSIRSHGAWQTAATIFFWTGLSCQTQPGPHARFKSP
jgi:hypothetical protein